MGPDTEATDNVRARRRNRLTGTTIELIDNREGSFDAGGQGWVTLCVDHGNYCEHESRKLAASFIAYPDNWCGECDDFVIRRGGKAVR
jgi:hypothetical protein